MPARRVHRGKVDQTLLIRLEATSTHKLSDEDLLMVAFDRQYLILRILDMIERLGRTPFPLGEDPMELPGR